MKEITRIHIAKVPYDIEITAKKSLEAYLKTLEAYSSDAEIIGDIEIRITEILADRGVKKGTVISDSDVTALKEQLGEPSEFMNDDAIVGKKDNDIVSRSSRKLFRNTDDAVLGGVAAGIASFFSINPMWVRLIFIIIGLASFGTVLLVYIVLWIAVPEAKTAADKLQMAGRPVTASSIRVFNENEVTRTAKSGGASGRRVLTILLGIASISGAIIATIMTVAATIAVVVRNGGVPTTGDNSQGFLTAAFVLAVVSGLLLAVLFILSAYASFAQKLTRRVLVTIAVVVALGLATFGTATGLYQYGTVRHDANVKVNTHETAINLPSSVQSMKALTVMASGVRVNYVVTSEPPTATLRTVGDEMKSQKVTASLAGSVLTFKSDIPLEPACTSMWCRTMQPTIVVRGPALDTLTTGDESAVDYATTDQTALSLNVGKLSQVSIGAGTIKNLDVVAFEGSSIYTSNAAVSSMKLDIRSTTHVVAGTIEQLAAVYPQSCPQGDMSMLDFDWISSGNMTVNGVMQPAKTTDNPVCAHIIINNDNSEKE